MIKELQGQIENVYIRNPITYDYDDAIFQIEIHEYTEGWNAQLMFKSEQIIDILQEFNVHFAHDLPLKSCYLLQDDSTPLSVPIGIKFHEDSEYIEVFNDFFSKLWK